MLFIDFEYDNRYLSGYGFIVCNFNQSNGAAEAEAGSVITFDKTSKQYGKSFSLTGTKYDSCVTCSFDICKNPDIYEKESMEISEYEFRELSRWLNRKEFLAFRTIDDNGIASQVHYYATFNVNKITINEKVYGMRLTMETNSPFGYGQMYTKKLSFTYGNELFDIEDLSDEIGYIYPNIEIKINGTGDLLLKNNFSGSNTFIKNCTPGEVINIIGESQIIYTSYASHKIYDDFNFDFFRIENSFYNRANSITASIPCEITISYEPIIKETPY